MLIVIAALAAVLGAVWLVSFLVWADWTPRIYFGLFLGALGGVVFFTLLLDLPMLWEAPAEELVGACFFPCSTPWQMERLLEGRPDLEAWRNVALFIPAAFLATRLWGRPVVVFFVGMGLSILIEIVQSFGLGVNDGVDVLTNTTGTFVGVWSASLVNLVVDDFRERTLSGRLWLRLVTVGVLVVGFTWAVSWFVTGGRVAEVERRLDREFGGSTVADVKRMVDEDDLDRLWAAGGPYSQVEGGITGEGATSEELRYCSAFYWVERCVKVKWDEEGFSRTRTPADLNVLFERR